MTCPPYCPSCGFNLHADELLTDGPFSVDPRGEVLFEGQPLRLAGSAARILLALLRAGGRTVTPEALLSRARDGESANLISVHVHRIRRVLRAAGAPCPIQTVRGLGYRWHLDLPVAEAAE
ncbi:winged helix-turn-helix domain-containing protein [Sphingomonas sp.]|jgi:DNA-binding response OmpR family regulator|uniref:winged helix-turn-helix domain-containing protein n=1 Tax=Sphingomonas sp. TaxID=28214 RepID=UPI0035C85C02